MRGILLIILVFCGSVRTDVNEDVQQLHEIRKLGQYIRASGDQYVRFIRSVSNAVSFQGLHQSRNIPVSDHSEGSLTPVFYHDTNFLADNTTTDTPVISTEPITTQPTTKRPTTKKPPKFPVSDICSSQWDAVVAGLTSNQMWAIKMIDAAGKPASNILGGGITWMGDFDECLSVKDILTTVNVSGVYQPFNAQHCKIRIPIRGALQNLLQSRATITTALCVPNSCSTKDVTNLIRKSLYSLNQNLTASTQQCIDTTDNPLDTRGIIVIVILCLFLAMMCAGTMYDIAYIQWPRWRSEDLEASCTEEFAIAAEESEKTPLVTPKKPFKEYQPGTPGKLLLSFSVYTNGAKILDTKQSKGVITCINGIRFISMTWVILGHTYTAPQSVADNQADFLPRMLKRWTFGAVCNAFVSVDTFFTLSGLLLTYLVMKEMKRNSGKMKWGLFYFHRFWRLTPPYMLVLMFYVSLFQFTGSGPNWKKDGPEYQNCEKAWYWNLLYINNFAEERENKCMGWAWYLANDMQFFVLSPLILLPLFHFHLVGLGVIMVFLIGTMITTGIISSHYDISVSSFDGGNSNFQKIYIKPYCRMGPYLVGMYTGYLLYRTGCRIRLNRYLNIIGWAVATAIALAVLYGLYDDINNERLSTGVAAFYNAVHRTAWGICVSWVIFACATGNGGYVNTLLSWKGFVPLSKLTYMTYLVHLIFINYWKLSQRKTVHLTDMEYIYEFLGHTVLSYMAAFVTSLAFESPMLGLESVLLKRKQNKR